MLVQLDKKRVKTLTRRIRDSLDLDDARGRKLADALAAGFGYKSYGALKAELDRTEKGPKAVDDLPADLRTALQRHPAPWSPRNDPDSGELRIEDQTGRPVRSYGATPGRDDRVDAYETCRRVNDAVRLDDLRARGLTEADALDMLQCAGHAVCLIDLSDVSVMLSHREGGDGEATEDQMDRAEAWLRRHRRELQEALSKKAMGVLDDALDAMPPEDAEEEDDGKQDDGEGPTDNPSWAGIRVKVRQIVPDEELDPNDRAQRPDGSWLVRVSDARDAGARAIELFHEQVPLSMPEHYALTLREVWTDHFPAMPCNTLVQVAWQIVDTAGWNVHGEPDDPVGLASYQLLSEAAAEQLRAAVEHAGLRLAPIALADVEEAEILDADAVPTA